MTIPDETTTLTTIKRMEQGKGKEKCTGEWYLRERIMLQQMYMRLPSHIDMEFEWSHVLEYRIHRHLLSG